VRWALSLTFVEFRFRFRPLRRRGIWLGSSFCLRGGASSYSRPVLSRCHVLSHGGCTASGDSLKTVPEQGMISLCLCGSRPSGKLIIRWSLVRIQAGPSRKAPLHVQRRYYRARVGLPKGRKKRRVPLSAELARSFWPPRDPDELLFTSEKGQRLDHSNLMPTPESLTAGNENDVRGGNPSVDAALEA
jgi:hypothetical protein